MAAGIFDEEVFPIGWLDVDTAEGGWFDEDLARDIASVPTIPARGLAMAAFLVGAIDSEDGTKVTYSWNTDILPPRDGHERRIATVGCPRESYEVPINLTDAQIAVLQSALVIDAAGAAAFGVALQHESLLITSTASGFIVNVGTTALSDWVYPGQVAAVVSEDGLTIATGVIQSSTGSTITLDTAVGSAGTQGGRVMPVIPCFLDDTQTLGLYPVNAGEYKLGARATYFGNATSDWSPLGATVTTYNDVTNGVTHPVWDKPINVLSTSPRALVAMTQLTDFGGVLVLTAFQTAATFARQIDYRIRNDADRQFLKAFHGATAGRQKAFYLPTWKPDLVPTTDASTSVLKVKSPSAGGGDYAGEWFQSLAHKHLMLVRASDGVVAYRTVTDAHDNLDGTQSLQLDSSFTGALSMVSFLETCRFDTDDFVVQYDGGGIGACSMPVMVIQQL